MQLLPIITLLTSVGLLFQAKVINKIFNSAVTLVDYEAGLANIFPVDTES